MKKEENLELIRKLATSKIDTSLLRSSRNLGNNNIPQGGILLRTIALEKDEVNFQRDREPCDKASQDSDDSDLDISVPSLKQDIHNNAEQKASTAALGSGLKRSVETCADNFPITRKRRRLSLKWSGRKIDKDLPWEGFSSVDESELLSENSLSDSQFVGTRTGSEPAEKTDSEFVKFGTEDGISDLSSISDDNSSIEVDSKQRSYAFKAWAAQQINEALGVSPTITQEDDHNASNGKGYINIKPREPELDPLPPELQVTGQNSTRKSFSVHVERQQNIQEARLGLPVVAEEQKIMEAIYNNRTVVIWGPTGSGKTTQVPQFLFEAGFGNPDSSTPGMIGVTQPRRVAAVSMAKRVGDELGSASSKVAYQIRFEGSVSNETAIKFMTDGILIREIANDFALLRYSAIIIDEAHERSVNTDILIGMISRIVDLRASMSKEDEKITPLKLIIMSATLRIADFMSNQILFRGAPPPLLQVEGRQYNVAIHFARITQRDYMEEAFRKISKGHKKLPPGAMLVFLTGQNEITALTKRLRETFDHHQETLQSNAKVRITAAEAPLEAEDLDLGVLNSEDGKAEDQIDGTINEFEEGDDQAFDLGENPPASSYIHVLPLYSQLQTKDQLLVFEPPPENSRLIVLATNVAETSLTIPGIRYVFDCGRAKNKKFDRATGIQSFEIGWISKASASQRAGRAGRTGPGHCYRLYSSAVYERDFLEHAEPEILRMPIEGVVLQLKSMDLQNVVNFPFPTPPDRQSLAKAEKLLTYLGAISEDGKITSVGREISIYPLSPRLSKMLLIGHQHGCMPYTIALVAALAVESVFILESQLDLSRERGNSNDGYSNAERIADVSRERRKKAYHQAQNIFGKNSTTSDALKALAAICAYAYAPEPLSFCNEMFLNPKSLKEAASLRQQLSSIVHTNHPALVSGYLSRLPPPSPIQFKALQQILAAAFIDQIAIRADLSPWPPDMPRKPSRSIDVPYFPLFRTHTGRTQELIDIAAFVHPSSVLAHTSPKELPQYIVYSNLQRGTPATIEGSKPPKTRLHALASVSGKQIAALAKGTPLLRYGKPIGKIAEEGVKRKCWVVPELVGDKGREGWPLPAIKVLQRKDAKDGWIVEKVIG